MTYDIEMPADKYTKDARAVNELTSYQNTNARLQVASNSPFVTPTIPESTGGQKLNESK